MDINEIEKIKLTGFTINMEYSKSAYVEGGIVGVNEYIVCDDIPLTINSTPNYLIKSSTVSRANILSRDCKVVINIAGKRLWSILFKSTSYCKLRNFGIYKNELSW